MHPAEQPFRPTRILTHANSGMLPHAQYIILEWLNACNGPKRAAAIISKLSRPAGIIDCFMVTYDLDVQIGMMYKWDTLP